MEGSILSILPPFLAIILAITTREIILSLFLGILSGWFIYFFGIHYDLFILTKGYKPIDGLFSIALQINHPVIHIFDSFASTMTTLVDVFKDTGNTNNILFTSLVGALIALTQRSGGVQGLINALQKTNFTQTPRKTQFFALIIGSLIVIENNISSLVTGAITRPLFERLNIARVKLAYVLDSTAAPICILIPFNAWGIYVISLLDNTQVFKSTQTLNSFSTFISAMPFNLYPILTILFNIFLIVIGKDFFSMKRFIHNENISGGQHNLKISEISINTDDAIQMPAKEGITPKAYNMVIPILIMLGMMVVSLVLTGIYNIKKKNITDLSIWRIMENASGSTSVLWSVISSIVGAGVLYYFQKILNIKELMTVILKGITSFIPISIILMLSFGIGDICTKIGTGNYLGHLAQDYQIHSMFIPAILFVISSIISFATGTSWGTWAIMIPISVAIWDKVGGSLPLVLGAILGGGIFGDHSSPISDTTIISSAASGCDVIDHTKTQLPYSLLIGILTTILLIIISVALN